MFRKYGQKFRTSYSNTSINVFFYLSFFDKNWRFKIFADAFKRITLFIRASNTVRTLKKTVSNSDL